MSSENVDPNSFYEISAVQSDGMLSHVDHHVLVTLGQYVTPFAFGKLWDPNNWDHSICSDSEINNLSQHTFCCLKKLCYQSISRYISGADSKNSISFVMSHDTASMVY